jgi:beta-galactosidase
MTLTLNRIFVWLFVVCGSLGLSSLCAAASGRQEVDLSGSGWMLWHDKQAKWQDDELFFPSPAISRLPVNPPTGGWEVLNAARGKNVAVPGTVEEYLQEIAGPEGDLTGVSEQPRLL